VTVVGSDSSGWIQWWLVAAVGDGGDTEVGLLLMMVVVGREVLLIVDC